MERALYVLILVLLQFCVCYCRRQNYFFLQPLSP